VFDSTWPSPQRRSTAFSRHGMVASASPNAALVGARTLGDGGTAFDAALSMALVEGVALPWACGLGGDMFCLLYHAATGQRRAISGSGAAPALATAELFRGQGRRAMPGDGPLSAGVPGALDAYLLLHENYGTRPWADLVRPAIDLAERGLVVTPRLAHYLQVGRSRLEPFAASVTEFLPDGRVGTLLRRPALARTLREVAETHRASFYGGRLGDAIARASEAAGGLLGSDDLAAHHAEIEAPIKTSYRGYEVYQPPLPSQGVIMLEMLNILEQFDLAGLDPLGDERIHLVAEAKRLAFADRTRWCGDPRFVDVPLARMLSKELARERGALIRPDASGAPEPSIPTGPPDDTTCCCAVDAAGNAIVLIHSLASNWGSGFVVEDTGILLNNRAGRGFGLDPDDPNRLEPGKRTMNTLNCCMLVRDNRPVLLWGTPGGDLGLQWNVQTLLYIVDDGIDPQTALELPRWHSFPGSDPAQQQQPAELQLEEGIDEQVLAGLRRRGHRVRSIDRWSAQAAMQLIAIDPAGPLVLGASDPRAEGLALGL
jgi:gamma-glutamyltranspeptidase / glutathione hydrolase